jgi:hypothetical protein
MLCYIIGSSRSHTKPQVTMLTTYVLIVATHFSILPSPPHAPLLFKHNSLVPFAAQLPTIKQHVPLERMMPEITNLSYLT